MTAVDNGLQKATRTFSECLHPQYFQQGLVQL